MDKLNITDENSLKIAIKLQKEEQNNEAISILNKLIKRNPNSLKVICFLGLFLAKIKDYKEAIPLLEKAGVLKPQNELLALTLYISYAKQKEYESAFKVLFKYLDQYPADLFKDTLVELLEGLPEGYGQKYKSNIIFYSKKNNIALPDELDNESS